jgi:hypothetical protein
MLHGKPLAMLAISLYHNEKLGRTEKYSESERKRERERRERKRRTREGEKERFERKGEVKGEPGSFGKALIESERVRKHRTS